MRDGTIWSVEHGPRGGDELNLVKEGSDYGWPLSTYGTNYGEWRWPQDPDPGRHSQVRPARLGLGALCRRLISACDRSGRAFPTGTAT